MIEARKEGGIICNNAGKDVNLNVNMNTKLKTTGFDFRPSPDGSFPWDFISTNPTHLRLLLSLIDNEPSITFKINTTCPTVIEKNARGVLTFLPENEVKSLSNTKDENNLSIDDTRVFITSAGCCNERSFLKISSPSFDVDRNDLVTIKLSDIPKLLKSLNSMGILFDSNSLSHLSSINEESFDALNIRSFQSDANYSLKEIENKIITEVENAKNRIKNVSIKELDSTKHQILKEATITEQNGEKKTLTYGHRRRPNPNSVDENFNIPIVAVTLTFLKDKEDNLFMVVNKENRPPIEGENVVSSPGGLCDLEDGDNIIASALRELKEETNIEGGEIYKNLRFHQIGYFASTSKSISETFGGVAFLAETDKLLGEVLENGNIRYIPKNSDGGVTDSVNLVKIDKNDSVESILSKLNTYGALDAHTSTLLNVFYLGLKENSQTLDTSFRALIEECF